jgi:hypothetical protein
MFRVKKMSRYKMKTGETIPLATFQLNLVKQMLQKFSISKPRASTSRRGANGDNPLRLKERLLSQISLQKRGKSKLAVTFVRRNKNGKTRFIVAFCVKSVSILNFHQHCILRWKYNRQHCLVKNASACIC